MAKSKYQQRKTYVTESNSIKEMNLVVIMAKLSKAKEIVETQQKEKKQLKLSYVSPMALYVASAKAKLSRRLKEKR